jgi:hypothetical protein
MGISTESEQPEACPLWTHNDGNITTPGKGRDLVYNTMKKNTRTTVDNMAS